MKQKLQLTVTGNETELREFVRVCQFIQSFGTYGMHRCVSVHVDGDGSGKLNFFYGSKEEEIPDIPLENLRTIESELGDYDLDIGE